MSLTVFRYSVPVDDEWHDIKMNWISSVLHVDARADDIVEFWAEHGSSNGDVVRSFRVFGTGHELPESVDHCGTVLVAGGALVWHLYERISEPQQAAS